jgi:hypothetical protein
MAKIAGIHNFQTAHASYWVSSNFTASSTVPINYDSKEYDVENCVTTSATAWKYTAKYAGVYEVEAFTYGTTSCNFLVYCTANLILTSPLQTGTPVFCPSLWL